MSRIFLIAAVLMLAVLSACTSDTTRSIAPDSVKASADQICRSGFTITLGRNGEPVDSTYTGCNPS